MSREMAVRIGLLGFGTIGSSVYRLIEKEHGVCAGRHFYCDLS